ncbi:hypothetical protein HRbin16_01763 [bacterium HR16]|nr:hypothetical protein HRbin16_01763 [bacterium HR16]
MRLKELIAVWQCVDCHKAQRGCYTDAERGVNLYATVGKGVVDLQPNDIVLKAFPEFLRMRLGERGGIYVFLENVGRQKRRVFVNSPYPSLRHLLPLRVKAYAPSGELLPWKHPVLPKVGITEDDLTDLFPGDIMGWRYDPTEHFDFAQRGKYHVMLLYDSRQMNLPIRKLWRGKTNIVSVWIEVY